jgi:5-methylcytosine-specific restriction protein A
MTRPAKVCPEPGCPHLAPCPTHRPDTSRPDSTARGYDRHWARIRGSYLRRHPDCEQPGCDLPATEVHHIDGHGPTGNNTDPNLMALCKSHHSRATGRGNRL